MELQSMVISKALLDGFDVVLLDYVRKRNELIDFVYLECFQI